MDFSTIFRTPHHAITFATFDRGMFLNEIIAYLKESKHRYESIEANVIDIDTARMLKSWSITSYGEPKIMVLSFHTITVPAQNALLKILEEPQEGSRFILITSNIDALLPTVRSRLQEQRIHEKHDIDKTVRLFLKTAQTSRIKLDEIEALLEARDEEDRKDREKLQAFISNLLEALVQEKVDSKIQKEVAQFALYASDPASSGKTLLEYLALRVPRVAL